jgi:hypothetical protein
MAEGVSRPGAGDGHAAASMPFAGETHQFIDVAELARVH